ncbi:unnamed protein product [Parascedosporium putredinis]|uniref:Uncharacterized protein n=1 Tax=Parascedosporium putredinis TaxID=1442378 RepID=A0A9P1H0T9_9PEZI|nr:unnamed protein product [Parascedosporium putredinis]CAI7992167.1 unnamed protein product [Parascedosporium putredinis]
MDLGDGLSIAKVAWEVYNYGWTPELNASVNYNSFGAEVRHLALNLDLLSRVISRADRSLHDNGGRASDRLRWDPKSLGEIVGDYRTTLEECDKLLRDNRKFEAATHNPLLSVGWNMLVQGRVDRLRTRIQMHNLSIQTVVKPFEIDLLTRVHQDLAMRMGAMHDDIRGMRTDLRKLMGELVPDLKSALDEQASRQLRFLSIPSTWNAVSRPPSPSTPSSRSPTTPSSKAPLRDMADAFIHHLDRSTVAFAPGLTVSERTPPAEQYVNLLNLRINFQRSAKSSPDHARASP